MEFSLPTPTQQSITLRSLLGDPSTLDRSAIATQIRTIDPSLWEHASVVAQYVGMVTELLPDVRSDERQQFVDAAWLHDIGKLTLPPEVLLQPGPLSEAEWADMRDHPSRGAAYLESAPKLRQIAPLVRHHHEWHDGRGYPDALHRSQIELGARLIAVADAFDAMTSWRPYRPALSYDDAVDELHRCTGTQFDPEIVDLFIRATGGHRAKAAP